MKETKVNKGGGKTPNWTGELLTFHITHLDSTMEINIWNEKKAKEPICSTSYFLNRITNDGVKEETALEMLYKGKPGGTVK